MHTPPDFVHSAIAADTHAVPKPFLSFAVRSEEARHAHDARAPCARVHRVRTNFLDADALARLAADGRSLMHVSAYADIAYAPTTAAGLAAATPRVGNLIDEIAAALQWTGVLGADVEPYRRCVAERIDYLASCGAGFHNDVCGHWTACLFWNLVIVAADVEFVMPHASLRVAVQPGDLIVFDPTMAHGLCRPRDAGQAVAESFEGAADGRQIFLSGELPLSDAHWAALGSPWLPVEAHQARGALDLMAAEFDERSGAIKGLRGLRDCMLRSTCYVDEGPDLQREPSQQAP